MQNSWTYVVTVMVSAAAIALGCAGAQAKIPPPPGVATTNGRVIKQAADGFCQLETDWQTTRSTGRVPLVAQNSDELAALWSAFGLVSKTPVVNFATYLVLGFYKPDGCNTSRIKELVVTSQAQLRVLEQEHSGDWRCGFYDRETVWVVAVSSAHSRRPESSLYAASTPARLGSARRW